MGQASQFAAGLDKLWARRTNELRALVIPRGAGQPAGFSKQVRERSVNKLLDLATGVLLRRDGKVEFRSVVKQRHLKRIKGRGSLSGGEICLRGLSPSSRDPSFTPFGGERLAFILARGQVGSDSGLTKSRPTCIAPTA